MTTFHTTLSGLPRGKERPRATIPWPWVEKYIRSGKRGKRPIPRVYTSTKYQAWEQAIADQLAIEWRRAGYVEPLDEPCALLLGLYFPRPVSRTRKTLPNPEYPHTAKPDGDNVAKAVQDAIEKAGIVVNDSRIFDLRVVKVVCAGGDSPRIEVALSWGFDSLPS